MALRHACEQILTEADLRNCPCALDQIDPPMSDEELEGILEAACDALALITRIPVGRCETVYRPCQDYCHYWGCPCGCDPIGIPLPGMDPTVVSVTIDGATVPGSEYTVVEINGTRYLERINADGSHGAWPSTQNIIAAANQPNTFAVTVESGTHPNIYMRAAAAELACEALAYYTNERRTEDGAVSATAYGVSLSYLRFSDPTDQDTIAKAGLSAVRQWLAFSGAPVTSAIVSNDLKKGWSMAIRG